MELEYDPNFYPFLDGEMNFDFLHCRPGDVSSWTSSSLDISDVLDPSFFSAEAHATSTQGHPLSQTQQVTPPNQTNSRTYYCPDPTCLKSFTNQKIYGKHTWLEHGIRAFQCPDCGFAATREDNLKQHRKSCRQRKSMVPVAPTEPKTPPKKSTRVTAASTAPERRRRVCIKNAKPMGPKSPTVSATAILSPHNLSNNSSRSPSAPQFDEESGGMGITIADSQGSIALLIERVRTLEEQLEGLAKKSDECAVWNSLYHQMNRSYRSLQTEIARKERVIESLRRELAHDHGKVAQPR